MQRSMTTIDIAAEPDLSIATTGNGANVAEATPEPSSPFFHVPTRPAMMLWPVIKWRGMQGGQGKSLWRTDKEIFVVSALILYLELLLIRWIGMEIRVFAYLG